jgi:hypothetical protein
VASLPWCSSSGSSSRVRNGMSGPDDCGSSPSRRPRWLPVPPGGQRTRRSRQSTCGTPRPMSLTSSRARAPRRRNSRASEPQAGTNGTAGRRLHQI